MPQSEHLSQLLPEIRRQSHVGPGVEPETAASFGGLIIAHEAEMALPPGEPRPITNFLTDVADMQMGEKGKKAPATVSVLRTSLINYMIDESLEKNTGSLQHRFSDQGLIVPAQYAERYATLSSDLQERSSLAVIGLDYSAIHRDASTSAMERTAAIELLLQQVKDRWPEGYRGLEIGCSTMTIPLQLMYKSSFEQRLNSVIYRQPGSPRTHRLTGKSNAMLKLPSAAAHFVANDKYPVYWNTADNGEERKQYDIGSVEFALNGLRPSERNDPVYNRRIRSLLDIKQRGSLNYDKEEKVNFWWGDLLDDEELEKFKAENRDQFNVIIMSFLTQELSLADQRTVHAIAIDLLTEDGVLIYNHQAYIHPRYKGRPAPIEGVIHYDRYANEPDRSQMHFVDRLMVAAPDQVQHAMTFHDNRCQDVKLMPAKLIVNGSTELLPDLINHHNVA